MADDDRRLAQRLRAYESRVPDAPEPSTSFLRGRMPWGIAGLAGAALLAVAIVAGSLANQASVGQADPTVSPSSSPSPTVEASPEPTPVQSSEASPTGVAPSPVPTAT